MKKVWLLALCVLATATTIITNETTLENVAEEKKTEPCPYCSKSKQETPITIFVHGGGKPFTSWIPLPGLNSSCERGVTHVGCPYSGCDLAKKYAKLLSKSNPTMFPFEGFYAFGWNGRLNYGSRANAGKLLYNSIRELRNTPGYEKTPITIITHSHGGNVALSIARAAENAKDKTLRIDRLILTACPVISTTECYISSPVFKEVISLYSKGDLLQVLGPQGGRPRDEKKSRRPGCFAGRRFIQSSNLIQAEVKFNHHSSVGHIGFLSRKFLNALPDIVRKLENKSYRNSLSEDRKNTYCLSIDTESYEVRPCKRWPRRKSNRPCTC